jgi:hypothetical protein
MLREAKVVRNRLQRQQKPPSAPDRRVATAGVSVAIHDVASSPDPARSRQGSLRLGSLSHAAWMVVSGLVLLVPLIHVTAILWVIQNHTFTAPWWDEWFTAFNVKSYEQGTLTLHDIWAFHWYTHRLVIPRVVDLILIELTHWNRQVELVFDLACGVATATLIVWCLWVTAKSRRVVLALLAPISILLFSMSYYYDWLLPFQITFLTTNLGVAISMTAVIRKPVGWGGWAAAVVGALVATLSSAAGLVAWFAFLPSMYKSGKRRLLAWCAVGIVTWVAYLHGFVQPDARPTWHVFRVFVLANLGAPVASPNFWLSERVGLASILAMGAVLAIYWRLHHSFWDIIVWLELALFALGTAFMIAEGRGLGGVWEALSTRYLIFPALWWVSLLVILGLTMRDLLQRAEAFDRLHWLGHLPVSRLVIGVGALAVLAITVGGLNADATGFQVGIAWQDDLRAHQACVTHYDTASNGCLGMWFWDRQAFLTTAAYMRAHHIANFNSVDQP